jgi:hypothetical protein
MTCCDATRLLGEKGGRKSKAALSSQCDICTFGTHHARVVFTQPIDSRSKSDKLNDVGVSAGDRWTHRGKGSGVMRLYVMSETLNQDGTIQERRERLLVMRSLNDASIIQERLHALLPSLAALCAIPAPAHEANLKAFLNQILTDASMLEEQVADTLQNDDTLTLKIFRLSQSGDNQHVYQLRYELMTDQKA